MVPLNSHRSVFTWSAPASPPAVCQHALLPAASGSPSLLLRGPDCAPQLKLLHGIQSAFETISHFSLSLSLSLSPSASVLHRHSGTAWQGTLFLIRRTAWGETLIWTSSASKRTALPGWAQRPGTANYTTLMLLPCWLIHSIKAFVCVCVCVCVRVCMCEREWAIVEILCPVIHPHILIFFLVYICPVMNINNASTTDHFSPHCASSRTLHIFKRVLWRPEAASRKGGSRFVQVPCLARAPCC